MNKLPEGWASVALEDHVYIAGRIGWRGLKRSEYTAQGALFLAVKNILPTGEIDFTDTDHISQERYDESAEIQLRPNDILLTKDGTIGKVGMISQVPSETTVNSSILVVRPNRLILPRYLFHFLRGPQFQSIANERITGSAIPHLFQKDIKKLEALVPPLEEQRRIVAKLDKLLSRADAAQARLVAIPRILKRFRQSVLAAAYSGKLTADWRKSNENLKEVFNLYKSRLHLRRNKFEIALDNTDLELLPTSWQHVPIGNISDFQQGMQLAKSTRLKQGGGNRLPILRILNYANAFTENVEYIEIDENSLIANELDVILARTGETRGKVLTGYRGVFHNNTFRLNYDKDLITRMYLVFWLETPSVQSFIRQESGRSAQPDLTHKAFGPCPFPLTSKEEQQEIVRRVEALFKTADALEARYRTAKAHVDKLAQSILARAFRGELVTTEAELARLEGRTYEPASVLLDRIRQERAQPQASARQKPKQQRAARKKAAALQTELFK
jgi:type I restriction enzyme, S subunit